MQNQNEHFHHLPYERFYIFGVCVILEHTRTKKQIGEQCYISCLLTSFQDLTKLLSQFGIVTCYLFLHHFRQMTNINWKAVIYNYNLSSLQKYRNLRFFSLPYLSELSCEFTANGNPNFYANRSLVRVSTKVQPFYYVQKS